MKNTCFVVFGMLLAFSFGFGFKSYQVQATENQSLRLGAFSVSLNVKDLEASKKFYEALGFTIKGGSMDANYLVMKNQNAIIGIFKGMFDKTMLTFNPGWDENAKAIDSYDDVREIQKRLKASGIKLSAETDENRKGPGYIMLNDPDGNPILIDQHL